MRIPNVGRSYAGAVVPLAALAGWLLQTDPGSDVDPGAELLVDNLLVNAVGGALGTLIVGGLLIAIATEYTDRNTRRIQREPGRTFLYGLGIFIAFLVVFVGLALTIVGLIIALPLALVAAFAFLVWGQLGYLAAGRLVADEKWPTLAVAVAIGFLVGIVPVLGALLGFVLGSMGVGAGFIDFRTENRRPPQPGTRRGPGPEWEEDPYDTRGGRGRRAGQSRRGGGPNRGAESGHRDRAQHERGGWQADDESGGWETDSGGDWDDDQDRWDD